MSIDIDEKIKNAQLKKLEAETVKIEAETSKLRLDIIKIILSAFAGLGIGVSIQQGRVYFVEKENNKIISQSEKMVKDTEKSVEPLKKEISTLRAEVQKSNPELVKKPLIYIQFQGDTTREFINELREQLQTEFNVPGAQRIAGDYPSEVRYFSKNQDDIDKAKHLAESVTKFYEGKSCSLNLPINFNNSAHGKSSPLEVWLADEDFCD